MDAARRRESNQVVLAVHCLSACASSTRVLGGVCVCGGGDEVGAVSVLVCARTKTGDWRLETGAGVSVWSDHVMSCGEEVLMLTSGGTNFTNLEAKTSSFLFSLSIAKCLTIDRTRGLRRCYLTPRRTH